MTGTSGDNYLDFIYRFVDPRMSGRGNIGESTTEAMAGTVESCAPSEDLGSLTQPLPLLTLLVIYHHHV